jgi:hypothetical protein
VALRAIADPGDELAVGRVEEDEQIDPIGPTGDLAGPPPLIARVPAGAMPRRAEEPHERVGGALIEDEQTVGRIGEKPR